MAKKVQIMFGKHRENFAHVVKAVLLHVLQLQNVPERPPNEIEHRIQGTPEKQLDKQALMKSNVTKLRLLLL